MRLTRLEMCVVSASENEKGRREQAPQLASACCVCSISLSSTSSRSMMMMMMMMNNFIVHEQLVWPGKGHLRMDVEA